MVARAEWPFEFDEEATELLWSRTGGHPFLAEMILSRVWDCGDVEQGLATCIGEVYDYYAHLERLLNEDQLFEDLLQLTVGPSWSLHPGSVERLLRYGLISLGANDRYLGWSAHFQAYLDRRSREGSNWDLWRETEQALREVIEHHMLEAYGPAWPDAVSRKLPSLAQIVEGCRDRQDREERSFGDHASRRLLDYSYPMDLWAILSHHWGAFKAELGRDKRYWGERFSLLSKVRTPTAHNRESSVPEFEIALARGYCKELLGKLRESG